MSFRGRGGGGGGGGRGFRGKSRGGGFGGNRFGYDQGPPERVVEVGVFTHTCEDAIVCRNSSGKVPHFNASIYFENKEQIGNIDEIFGGVKNHGFSVKLSNGVKASSFKTGQKVYIDQMKLLPIERFTNPNGSRGQRGRRPGGDRGGSRGRGSFGRGGGGSNRGGGGGFGRGGGGGGFNRGGGGGGFSRGGGGGGFNRGGGSFGRGSGDFNRSGDRGHYQGGQQRGDRSFGGGSSGGSRGRGSDRGFKRDFGDSSYGRQNKRTKFDDD